MSLAGLGTNAVGNKVGAAAGNAVTVANQEAEVELSAASVMKVKADVDTKLRDLAQETSKNIINVEIKGSTPINF